MGPKALELGKPGTLTGAQGAANIKKMLSMFDPRMVAQMGGADNFASVMRNFSELEGQIPGLAAAAGGNTGSRGNPRPGGGKRRG